MANKVELVMTSYTKHVRNKTEVYQEYEFVSIIKSEATPKAGIKNREIGVE